MAMTKRERAEMDAAIERAETLAALRWTAPVEPDVSPPPHGQYSEGWTFNLYGRTVERAWSTSSTHGRGARPEKERHWAGSQGSQRLFSTEARALAALRYAVETQAARELLIIDRRLKALKGAADS